MQDRGSHIEWKLVSSFLSLSVSISYSGLGKALSLFLLLLLGGFDNLSLAYLLFFSHFFVSTGSTYFKAINHLIINKVHLQTVRNIQDYILPSSATSFLFFFKKYKLGALDSFGWLNSVYIQSGISSAYVFGTVSPILLSNERYAINKTPSLYSKPRQPRNNFVLHTATYRLSAAVFLSFHEQGKEKRKKNKELPQSCHRFRSYPCSVSSVFYYHCFP